jgi:hypothetical protein
MVQEKTIINNAHFMPREYYRYTNGLDGVLTFIEEQMDIIFQNKSDVASCEANLRLASLVKLAKNKVETTKNDQINAIGAPTVMKIAELTAQLAVNINLAVKHKMYSCGARNDIQRIVSSAGLTPPVQETFLAVRLEQKELEDKEVEKCRDKIKQLEAVKKSYLEKLQSEFNSGMAARGR